MTAILDLIRKYRKLLIPAAILLELLFAAVVIRKMTVSDNPLATSGWLFWAAGIFLFFLGLTCSGRNFRFGLMSAGILMLYPGLFCRNHYDGFIYAWLGLVAINILGIIWARGKKFLFVALCNLLPLLIFLTGVVAWFNLDYLGRTSKASEYPCRQDPELGYVHVENRKIDTSLYHYWKKVVSAQMTLDPRGRRITPDNPPGREIIFIGCSFTEGALLADQETLPYRIGELSGRRVLNLGVSGYGIHQFQRMLELDKPWHRQVPEECSPALVIYLGITNHASRIANSALPAYELKDGRSVPAANKNASSGGLAGFLNKGLKHNFLGILLQARFTDQNPSKRDIELYTASVSQCAEMLKKKYPACRFLVLYHDAPHNSAEKSILRILKEKQIQVIPVSSLVKKPLSDPVYRIPYDGHPSAQCWKEAAPELWKILSADPQKSPSAKDGTGKNHSDPGRRYDVIHPSGKLEP